MIIIAIKNYVLIVNFRNHLYKALTEIFQFRRALLVTKQSNNDWMNNELH